MSKTNFKSYIIINSFIVFSKREFEEYIKIIWNVDYNLKQRKEQRAIFKFCSSSVTFSSG